MSVFCSTGTAFSQSSSEKPRRVIARVAPRYPALARKMALDGNVRADVVVSPNGSFSSAELKGHPLFVQAAQSTLREWKWEPSPHETHELVELKFTH